MKTNEFIQQASDETSRIARNIEKVIDDYLDFSLMDKNQRIVNVGRALNAVHVAWIANLGSQLETTNNLILDDGARIIKPFDEPVKEF